MTSWTAAHQAASVLPYLPQFAQIHVHWVSDAIQLSHPLPPPSTFAIYLSQHQVSSNQLALRVRWLKSGSFSFSPSNEYSGLISFMIHWFDLLAEQGILKSILRGRDITLLTKIHIIKAMAFPVVVWMWEVYHKEGNYKQGEKTALRMGENNSKWRNGQRINLKNIQAASAAQFQ